MATSFYLPVLTHEQLHRLKSYTYRGEDRSITYRFVMAPFYNRAVTWLPLWLAPNMVTLLGFVFPLLAHLLLLRDNEQLENELSRWKYVFAACSLFFYMVMDNLDGKQARRTNSSSPLGHMLDHGLDALNVTISGLSLLAAVRLHPTWLAATVIFCLGHLSMMMAALEEHHTGAMILGELNGPNEGLLTLCALQLFTAYVGPAYWTNPLGDGLPAHNIVLCVLSIAPTLNAVVGNVRGVARHYLAKGASASVVWRAAALFAAQCVPVILIGLCELGTTANAPSFAQHNLVPFLWLCGIATFDVVTRTMLATLVGSAYPFCPSSVVALSMVSALAVANEQTNFDLQISLPKALYTALAISGIGCAWWTWCAVSQICSFLNIRCFSLRPLHEDEQRSEKTR